MTYKYNPSLHFDKIMKLREYSNKFKYTDIEKFRSQITSEIYNTLLTEGEVSSKRDIRKSIDLDNTVDTQDKNILVLNQIKAFHYIFGLKDISINTFGTLFNILTGGVDLGKNKIEEGYVFRQDDVTIGSKSIDGNPYYGTQPKNIISELKELIDYINSDEDVVIKAIVAHFIFEVIHPFYDFNGRTGRFIPQIISNLSTDKVNVLNYFSTAVGTYRDQYISAFKKSIIKNNKDKYNPQLNIDKFIDAILDLLLLNQYQYEFISDIEQEYLNQNKSINGIEKSIILELIRKYEIQQNPDAWCKADFIELIEINLKQPQFSRAINNLVSLNIIEKSDTKPMRIKLVKKYNLLNKK